VAHEEKKRHRGVARWRKEEKDNEGTESWGGPAEKRKESGVWGREKEDKDWDLREGERRGHKAGGEVKVGKGLESCIEKVEKQIGNWCIGKWRSGDVKN